MAFQKEAEKIYPPFEEWIKTQNLPKRTPKQKKEIEDKFNSKLKKLFKFYGSQSTEEYLLYLKWKEVQKKIPKYSQKDIAWVKKLIWKPKDSKNYRGDFRRIYPELILCGNDFEIEGRDVFNQSTTFDYGEKDNLLKHWRILRLIVSRAPDEGAVGRQFRYIVRDRDTKKYLGIICISSDMVDTSQRNVRIGLPKNFRKLNTLGLGMNVTANGQTIVPTDIFGKYFLGGKLMALLCLSKEVCSQWKQIYGDTLIGVTTTSLYGNLNNRLTQYDNLTPYWVNCGSTKGDTPYKLPNDLEEEFRKIFLEHHPQEYYRHFVKGMRETKKRAGQWWLKYMGIKEGSNQPRGVYYSRIYKESDEYFRKIIKIFEEVCIEEKVYKKIKVKKELKSIITIKKEKITEVLKNKLWNKTLERMNKELTPDDKLTPAFDNSISALTNYWKYGLKGDTQVLPEDTKLSTILRRGGIKMKDDEIEKQIKQIGKKQFYKKYQIQITLGKTKLQKDLGMLKGNVDSNNEKYNKELELRNTYDGLANLTYEEIKKQYV